MEPHATKVPLALWSIRTNLSPRTSTVACCREAARSAVLEGRVLVSGASAQKPDRLVAPGDPIVLVGPPPKYVSRGGLKLEAALDRFGIDPHGLRSAQLVVVDADDGLALEPLDEDQVHRFADRGFTAMVRCRGPRIALEEGGGGKTGHVGHVAWPVGASDTKHVAVTQVRGASCACGLPVE